MSSRRVGVQRLSSPWIHMQESPPLCFGLRSLVQHASYLDAHVAYPEGQMGPEGTWHAGRTDFSRLFFDVTGSGTIRHNQLKQERLIASGLRKCWRGPKPSLWCSDTTQEDAAGLEIACAVRLTVYGHFGGRLLEQLN